MFSGTVLADRLSGCICGICYGVSCAGLSIDLYSRKYIYRKGGRGDRITVLTVQLIFYRDSEPAAGMLRIGEAVLLVPIRSLGHTHQRVTAHLHGRCKRAKVLAF